MATINPYLIFDGNAEGAFNFYKSVFGTEYDGGINRFKESADKFGINWMVNYDYNQ